MKKDMILDVSNQQKTDQYYMNLALKQAQKAYENKEVPIGALIIDASGEIIGMGYNTVEKEHCSLRHAELIALESAMKTKNDWRLSGCVMYVTLEPCVMCYGALNLSRIDQVIYGAASSLYGFTKEVDLFMSAARYKTVYTSGVLEKECAQLLNNFFKSERFS